MTNEKSIKKNGLFYLIMCLIAINLNATTFIPPDVYKVKEVLDPKFRHSSFPYISGDTFRSLAKFSVDEFRNPFDLNIMKDGDIIFLRNYWMDYFFRVIHPRIKKKYILITNNSVWSSPGKYSRMLNDPKIIAWFAQNVNLPYDHPKLFHIPVGIANAQWAHGDIKILNSLIPQLPTIPKKNLVYINFSNTTNRAARSEATAHLANKSFCYKAKNKPWPEYLMDLAQSKFIICPLGNGLDCHRTWEALLMGSVPIVKTSSLDKLYDNLPVVIVKKWNEVTEEFLNNQWDKINNTTYDLDKIYAQWWIDLIKNCQQTFLEKNLKYKQ